MANTNQTTAYSFADTLPKDAGGAKFGALLQTETSAPGFAVPRGIGPSQLAGTTYITAHTGVAAAVQGSPIGNGHPQELAGGVYIENPNNASNVLSGRARSAYVSRLGELHATPVALAPSLILGSGSRDTFKTSSGIVYSIMVTGASVNKGDTITLQDQLKTIAQYTFGQNYVGGNNGIYETGRFDIPPGGWRIGIGGLTGTSMAIVKSIAAGTASIIVTFS